MKINTRLRIAALVPAVMASVIGVAILFSYRAIQTAEENDRAVQRIISGMNELNSLAGEYVIYHEERARQQFLAEHDSITQELSSVRFRGREQRRLLNTVRSNVESMKHSFVKMASNYELLRLNENDTVLREAEDRLAGQLLVKSRQVVADGLRLERLVDDEISTTQRTVNTHIFFLIVAVTVPLTIVLFATMKGITVSLALLREGTEVVGTGNLAHRIDMLAGDELGELARSFDQMTEQLQAVTVSKDELQQEVEERKQAEEESRRLLVQVKNERQHVEELAKTLQQERDTLQAMMGNTNAHVAYLDPDFNFIMVNSTYAKGSGHSKEELIGGNHFEFFPNPENEAVFHRARDTGEIVEFKAKPFEFVDQPWRGITYWDWTLTPVKDASGGVRGLILSLVDVTDVIRAGRMSDALNDINATINSLLDFDEIMRGVIVEAAKAMGVETAAIVMREGRYWVPRYVYGFPESVIGGRFAEKQIPFVTEAARNRSPVAIEDAHTDPRTNHEILRKYGVRAVLVVPLMIRDEVIGVFFFNYSHVFRFTSAQLDFARKLGTSLSLGLANVRLYHELTQSREEIERQFVLLQRALLPAKPTIGPGYRLGSAYVPAFAGEEIGGDFYDVFQTEDGRVSILIGDVSGKGIEAASVGAATRNTLRAFVYETSSPSMAFTHTNSLLTRQQVATGHFVTVFLAVLDRATGEICYSSAGHPPPMLYRPDGVVETLAFGDIPIGVAGEYEYREAACHLKPGDKMILYTDGITEARHSSNLFGLSGLCDVLAKHGREDPETLVSQILAAADNWARGHLSDDIAIIAIERE